MSKKVFLLCAICALSCIAVSAQNVDWKKFTSADGKFSAVMPCFKPLVEVEKLEEEADDDDAEQTYTSCTVDEGFYVISYMDLDLNSDSDGNTVMDAYRDGLVKGTTVISEKRISLGKISGRELVLKKSDDDGVLNCIWRLFLKGKRIYAVGVVTDKDVATSQNVSKFLTSFAFTK